MKKFVFFFALLISAGLSIMTSCSDNNDTTPADITPAMNFIGGTGYISANATLTAGAEFKVGINSFANTTSNAKLVKFTITRVVNNNPFVVLDSTINVSNFSIEILTNAQPTATSETWYYKITDKDNQTKQLSLTITTVSSAGPINTFSMKILGSYQNATGSSFASIDGTIYTLADAKANAAKIDWLYYYGASAANHATIASPKDTTAETVYDDAVNGLKHWSVRNNTLFKKVTDVIDWNSITNDEIIVAQTASGVTNTMINQLAINEILSFITVTGKKGMIKVENIEGTTAGTITISVKVQQ
jgi:hypothetical protein